MYEMRGVEWSGAVSYQFGSELGGLYMEFAPSKKERELGANMGEINFLTAVN